MKRISQGAICASAMVLVFGAVGSAQGQGNGNGQGPGEGQGEPEVRVHGMNPHDLNAPTKGSTGIVTPPISYSGGALLTTPKIFYIWYGNWGQSSGSDTPAGQQILRDFATGISGSAYFQINTTYSVSGKMITGNTLFSGEFTDNYSRGTRLRDADILTIVNNALSKGMSYDASGVYFVLTSSDVNEQSGFCTKYCGWHTSANSGGRRIRYSFVGNANRCLNACAAQTVSPNGNAGVDGMASVIAHELEEATTDADPLSGWSDRNGAENADKCAWTFGQSMSQTSTGAYYNMHFGGRNFLIQRNLKHSTSGDTCNIDLSHQ